jgi:enoyl-CoA hydratase/carnithine racemase
MPSVKINRANDFDGDTAEQCDYVNRALSDAELDDFVDVLARRIASSDQRPIAAAKNLNNRVPCAFLRQRKASRRGHQWHSTSCPRSPFRPARSAPWSRSWD